MEYSGKPLVNPSLIGEPLSKAARHRLAVLCLEAIKQEYVDKPISDNSQRRGRGRPPGPERILAQQMDVSKKTVDRWLNPKDIQANDLHADQLAQYAFKNFPDRTAKILIEDAYGYIDAVDEWLTTMSEKYGISPCQEIKFHEGKKKTHSQALETCMFGESHVKGGRGFSK